MPEVRYVPRAFSRSRRTRLSRQAWMVCSPISESAACNWMRRTEDLVFGPTAAGHADGYAQRRDGRTSGKSGRRRRSRQPDLRIRRGKEVAENRQSYCAGAADCNNSRTCSSDIGRCPINKRRQDSSRYRTFQAIRIRVNDELGEIQSLLKSAGSLLKPGGRVVLISFHSLEDRLVKDAFRDRAKAGKFEVLTKKPVVAKEQESLRNPRSRSAKTASAQKV